MAMPELSHFFGFPLRFGCFVIAVIGLGLGGGGIAGIVIYGLVENEAEMSSTNKMVLATIGMSSLVLIAANTPILLGVLTASSYKIGLGKWITFVFVIFLLGGIVFPSLGCYLDKEYCSFVNDSSIEALVAIYGSLGLVSMVWLYFIITIHNYQERLS